MKVCGVRFKDEKDIDEIFRKVESYREEHDVFLQLFDASKVIGEEHLLWAYQKAEEAFENDENRAVSLDMETLLWASAQWQIKDAIDKMGVSNNLEKAVVLIEGNVGGVLEGFDAERDDDIIEPSIEKMKNFGVSSVELKSVSRPYDLVFEKMATSVL